MDRVSSLSYFSTRLFFVFFPLPRTLRPFVSSLLSLSPFFPLFVLLLGDKKVVLQKLYYLRENRL